MHGKRETAAVTCAGQGSLIVSEEHAAARTAAAQQRGSQASLQTGVDVNAVRGAGQGVGRQGVGTGGVRVLGVTHASGRAVPTVHLSRTCMLRMARTGNGGVRGCYK